MMIDQHVRTFAQNIRPNTVIGGIGNIINTPSLLAQKLGINASRISGFKIINNNVECKISGTYNHIGVWNNTTITKYNDIDNLFITYFSSGTMFTDTTIEYISLNGLIRANFNFLRRAPYLLYVSMNSLKTVSNYFLENIPLVQNLDFPELTNIGQHFITGASSLKYLAIKKVKTILGTPAQNQVITGVSTGCVIDVNIALSVINSGSPAQFLIWLKGNGCIVNFYDDNANYISTL